MRSPLVKNKPSRKPVSVPVKEDTRVFFPGNAHSVCGTSKFESTIRDCISELDYSACHFEKEYAIQITRDFQQDEDLDIRTAEDIVPEVQYINAAFKLLDSVPTDCVGTLEGNTVTVLASCKTQFGKLSKTLPKGSKIIWKEQL